MSRPRLNLTEATKIKRRLWDGETSEAIASDYEITPWAVYHIASGMRWKQATWPDGRQKGMDPKRRQTIMAMRRKVAKEQLGKRVKQELSKT